MDCPRCGEFESASAKRCSGCGLRFERRPEGASAGLPASETGEGKRTHTARKRPARQAVEHVPPHALHSRGVWPGMAALMTASVAMDAACLALMLMLSGQAPGRTQGLLSDSFSLYFSVASAVQFCTGIVLLFWLHRMWLDVLALRADPHPAFTPRQAVVGCLIPFYHLLHYWRVFSALHRSTRPELIPDPEIDHTDAGYREVPTATVPAPRSNRTVLGVWLIVSLLGLVTPLASLGHAQLRASMAPSLVIGLINLLLQFRLLTDLQHQLDEQHRRAVARHTREMPRAPSPLPVALLFPLPTLLVLMATSQAFVDSGASLLPLGAAVLLPTLACGLLVCRWLARRHADLTPPFAPVIAVSIALLAATATSASHQLTRIHQTGVEVP